MINFSNINLQTQNYKPSFTSKSQAKLSNREQLSLSPNNKKISFYEGRDLIFKGFATQAMEMLTSIIEHPIKTAALVGSTALGLMSLPLIGIPTAVGGSFLALGFAGYAAGKTIYHAALFAKNNKKGSYHTARMNLQKIGEDTFDLALSTPFAPKAANQIKNFGKYGKVKINKTIINELKSNKTFQEKLKIIQSTDKELLRDINYQNAVDKEILSAATDSEKAQLKQNLLEFNIHPDEIPKVILNKYSEIKGIKTQPDLKYESLPSNVYGYAIADDCSIFINNFKQKLKNNAFDNYQQLSSLEAGDEIIIMYKEKKTGKIISDNIKKEILNAYNNLLAEYSKLTPEAKRILTTLHEREHISQYAQIISKKGYDWIKHSITPRGKELFNQMVIEMPKIDLFSPKALEIESYLLPPTSKTLIGYLKQTMEINARKIEMQAINNPTFQKLNNIFKKVNNSNTLPLAENILLNDTRFESAKS